MRKTICVYGFSNVGYYLKNVGPFLKNIGYYFCDMRCCFFDSNIGAEKCSLWNMIIAKQRLKMRHAKYFYSHRLYVLRKFVIL